MRIGLHVEALIQDIRFSFRWLLRERVPFAVLLRFWFIVLGMSREPIGLVMLVLVVIGTAGLSAADRRPLGEIDFFGYKGLDLAGIRVALPFHEGDSFPPAKVHSDDLKRQVGEAVTRVIGREPTSVSFVCCDAKQNYMVYKASLVLVALTTARDPQVLAQLRTEVLDSLLEMARWRSIGHAEAALTILGRMAGIDEQTLNKLIDAGQTAAILGEFGR